MRKYSAPVFNGMAFAAAISLFLVAIVHALQAPSIWTAGLAWRALAVGVTLLSFLLIVRVGDWLHKRAEKPMEFPRAFVRRDDRIDRAA